MTSPTRRDGIPRLSLELTQAESKELFHDAYLGGCIRRALEHAPSGSLAECSPVLQKLLSAIVTEEGPGGAFNEPVGGFQKLSRIGIVKDK